MSALTLAYCCAILITCVGALIRNAWVYKTRMSWLNAGHQLATPTQQLLFLDRYSRDTAAYDEMMLRWWCWNRSMDAWRKP